MQINRDTVKPPKKELLGLGKFERFLTDSV